MALQLFFTTEKRATERGWDLLFLLQDAEHFVDTLVELLVLMLRLYPTMLISDSRRAARKVHDIV